MTPDAIRTCEIFRAAIAAGQDESSVVGELATWFGVQRPAIWKRLRAGGEIPPYEPRQANGRCRRRERSLGTKNKETANLPRVDRDPCQRCGVRHDVGCHHTRAPVGMVL